MDPGHKGLRAMTDFTFSMNGILHPDHLWAQRPGVYVDETNRSWVPVFIEEQGAIRVLIRQEDVPLGEAVGSSNLSRSPLPLMWHLYPGKRYRGSDASFWNILYHIQVAGTEDMLLQQVPHL